MTKVSIHIITFTMRNWGGHTFTHTFQLFRHFHRRAFQGESKHTLPAERGSNPWSLTTTSTLSETGHITPPQTPQHKLRSSALSKHTRQRKERSEGAQGRQEGTKKVTELIRGRNSREGGR